MRPPALSYAVVLTPGCPAEGRSHDEQPVLDDLARESHGFRADSVLHRDALALRRAQARTRPVPLDRARDRGASEARRPLALPYGEGDERAQQGGPARAR